jgi:hypothetical protein
MQTYALNLHQKTAGGYIRPFAATTGTISDADLRPQPSPEDGWRLHTDLRRHYRYNHNTPILQTSALNLHQKTAGGYIRPFAASTGTVAGCCRDCPDTVFLRHVAGIVGITNDICRIRIDFFLFRIGFITDLTNKLGQVFKNV